MKKEQITPEVIELSKKIAKKWRMPFYKGCWWVDIDIICLYKLDEIPAFPSECFPIPSIADCLEKLAEYKLGLTANILVKALHGEISYKTIHEALLSALLEVL